MKKAIAIAWLMTALACSANNPNGSGPTEFSAGSTGGSNAPGSGAAVQPTAGCVDEEFALQVWAPVLATQCLACHRTNGLAPRSGSRFVLADASVSDYLNVNLEAFRKEASLSGTDANALLLLKPSAQVSHGGGKIIDPSSASYQALAAFLKNTDTQSCIGTLDTSGLTATTLASASDTVRRAAMQLVGRMPTTSEATLAQNGNLTAALTSVLNDPGFGNYVLAKYNDDLLTDQFLGQLLAFQEYEIAGMHPNTACATSDLSCMVPLNDAYARIPLQLIRYVVVNNHPFDEVLTANYTVVNPTIVAGNQAFFAGSTQAFVNASNTDEWVPTTAFSKFQPQAGILGNMAILNGITTTASNLNRHRASILYNVFLNTDIPGLPAQLPADLSAVGTSTAVTRSNPGCAVCHVQLDAMGGSLQNWDGGGIYTTPGNHTWPTDDYAAGFEGTPIPSGDLQTNSIAWLAKQMVADQRFGMSIATHWLTQLTGIAPLPDVSATDPHYAANLRAKNAQNAFLTQVANDFMANNRNLKSLVIEILQSPYYRVAPLQTVAGVDGSFAHSLRRGPEDMGRALNATLGTTWAPLASTYDVAFGGIDSQNATVRNFDINGVTANIVDIMAVTVACQNVAKDFNLATSSRRLFPFVSLTSTDSTSVRKNITYLYTYLLNTQASSADVDDAYNLFQSVYSASHTASDTSLDSACQSGSVTNDNTFTVKAWVAVVDFMLGDYAFIYE